MSHSVQIPHQKSGNGPSMANLGNLVSFVAWTDTNQAVWLSTITTKNGIVTVGTPTKLEGIHTKFAPSLCFYNKNLYLAYTALNQRQADLDQKSIDIIKIDVGILNGSISSTSITSITPTDGTKIFGAPSLFTDTLNGTAVLGVTWTGGSGADLNKMYLYPHPNATGDTLANNPIFKTKNTPANCDENYIAWTDLETSELRIGKIKSSSPDYTITDLHNFDVKSSVSPAILYTPLGSEGVTLCFSNLEDNHYLYTTTYPAVTTTRWSSLKKSELAPALCLFTDDVNHVAYIIIAWTESSGDIYIDLLYTI